jgi:short-subunit dehydrogenase
MRHLRGTWALVTGAASGIGQALTLALAREGVNLLLVDVDAGGLDAVAALARGSGVEVQMRVADLACGEQVQALADSIWNDGPMIDLLINNAGVLHYGPSEQMRSGELERLIAVNLLAPLRLTRALLPMLLCRPESHLVNISSVYGLVVTPRSAAYHASKFGLLGFSESLAIEYAGTSFHVTTVCPGFVWTSLFASSTSGREDGRLRYPPRWLCVTPEYVANTVVRAIYRNRRLVMISALAKVMYVLQRLAPWLPWLVQTIRRRKKHSRT